MAQETLLTAEAYNKKHAELERLKTSGRDEIAERIKEARSFGDLSENSEYDEALNDQAKLEAKISQLEAELKDAKILDESTINTEIVHMGSKVKILDEEYDEVGKALLGHKAGDVVDVLLPNGSTISFKILEISK